MAQVQAGSVATRIIPHGLRDAEQRFRNTFVQAALPQMLADVTDRRFVAVNDEFCKLVGYDEDELVSRGIFDLMHPADARAARERVRLLMDGTRDGHVAEGRFFRKDGTVVYVQAHVRLVRDDDGVTRYLHVLLVDRTALHQAEQALAATEARLRALAEHTDDLVLLVSADGLIRHAGPSGDQIAALVSRRGASLFDLVSPAEAARLRECLTDTALQGATRRIRVRSDLGGRRHWDVRLSAQGSPGLDGIVATLRDLTGEVRNEELAEGEATILRMVIGRAPREQVLDAVTRLLEALYPELRATVLLASQDHRRLTHGAAPSMSAEYIRGVDGLRIAPGSGVCGTAAATNEPVIVEDVRYEPMVEDYRDLLAREGVRSMWSLPIGGAQGEVAGTLALYGAVPSRPTPDQWRVAHRIAHLAGLVCGNTATPRGAAPEPAEAADFDDGLEELTPRERDVLRLLALGHTNHEVAEQLCLSVRTVESQRAGLSRKLGTRARADFVRAAIRGGLLRG